MAPKSFLAAAGIFLVAALFQPVKATTWDWSFDQESGQFITSGTGSAPGTYTLSDFSVTSSAAGGTIGSLTGGQYDTNPSDDYYTYQPYSFVWNGSQVTAWLNADASQAYANSFNWWVFNDTGTSNLYFFSWNAGNVNDPTSAAYYSSYYGSLALGPVDVTPVGGGSVPDGATTYALFGFALAALGGLKRRFV